MVDAEAIGGPVTGGQAACLMAYLLLLILWTNAEYLAYRKRSANGEHREGDSKASSEELIPIVAVRTEIVANTAPANGKDGVIATITSTGHTAPTSSAASSNKFSFIRLLALDNKVLIASLDPLRAAVEMGTILLWFYIADRTPTIAAGAKEYIRDVFLFIFLVLTLVAGSYTMRQGRAPVLINRQQTEEWKGWMQVLFLLYHYYEAREAYNAIRIFIASYVWMTGFGNFAYYYKTRDFSIGRFFQMMWRLNLLAFLCCMALDNEYMLYYICPMHTLFTIMVYVALGLWQRGNDIAWGIWSKIGLCFVVTIGVWEIRPVFYALWKPFGFFLGYTDPRRPNPDALHEWYFRTGLDKYIWIYGMVCAYVHPRFEAWLKGLETENIWKRRAVRAAIVGVAGAMFYAWYVFVFRLPKLEYNVLHPYTSWIPITAYLMVRNLTPPLRLNAMGLYGWLGCITLETYVAQYHTWLLSKVPNSQPIYLLNLLPGYPLLNFGVVTGIYIFVSHRLFQLTATLRDAVVPHDDVGLLVRNMISLVLGIGAFWGAGAVMVQLAQAL